MNPDEVGRCVATRRRELGWSQERLAAAAGTTRATVDGIEKGRTRTPYRLRDVYRALGWPETGPVSAADEQELAAIRARLRGDRLSESELDIAARAIQAVRRNLPETPSPGHDQAV